MKLPVQSRAGSIAMLSRLISVTLRQAMAKREIENSPQTVLFEEIVPCIDTSKMERVKEPFSVERRITDNVIRFMQVFVGDRRFVVDLPNTVLSPSEVTHLLPRGFDIDFGCSFKPLQKYYGLSQIDDVTADLEFVWNVLWLMRTLPQVKIYSY